MTQCRILILPLLTLCAALAQAASTPLIGTPPLKDLTGKATTLGAYQGRVVLLNFWATWCAPCLAEMPELNRVHRSLDAKQAVVVGVAADELAEAQKFVQKLGVNYPIVVGEPDAMFKWSAMLGNVGEGLPFTVLIDRSGKVRWTKSGGRLTEKEARAEIGKLMVGASIAPAGARGMPTPPPDGQPGVRAPDGIGVVVAPSPGSGPMANGPWEPGSLATPLLAGASVPANSLVKDLRGKSFDLNAAIAAKPTVLVFYRGGWCPYCNAHLRELQKSAPQLQKMGYQILAVSTDTPEKLQGTLEKNQLEYTLLSDAKAAVTARFGLKYKVVSSYLDHVKNDHGTDLVAQNGGYLLTPAAYVLDRKGKIRFAYVNNNYAVRVGQDKLLQAAAEALR